MDALSRTSDTKATPQRRSQEGLRITAVRATPDAVGALLRS